MRARRRIIIIGMVVTNTHTTMQHFLRRVDCDNRAPCMDEEFDMFQIGHKEGVISTESTTCSDVKMV